MKNPFSSLMCYMTGLIFLLGQTVLMAAPLPPESVTLLSSVKQFDPKQEQIIYIGLKFQMPVGYDTYWKWSNGLGQPLSVTWEPNDNIQKIKVLWPLPKRMNLLGYDIYGYNGTVVFPLKIVTNRLDKPINLKLRAKYLICAEENCQSYDRQFSIIIPNGKTEYSSDKTIIDEFLKQVPIRKDLSTLPDINTYISHKKGKCYYNVAIDNKNPSDLNIFVAAEEGIELDVPQKNVTKGKTLFTSEIKSDLKSAGYASKQFSVVVSSAEQAIEFKDSQILKSEVFSLSKILLILLSGFIGGLILNLMPCVLPVLMLKVMEVVHAHQHQEQKSYSKLLLISSGMGMLCSIMLFAVITLLLKQIGHAASWGMHFQEPMYLITMASVLMLFSCNLLGYFEIYIPTSNMAAMKTNGLVGSFLNGVVITLLAIPCTAPFLGTAISYSLSQPTLFAMIIFASIGLGFSLPYFAMAFSPELVKKILPKPGMWMVTFKKSIGIILILTTVWILWVLSAMVSQKAILVIVASFFATAAILYFTRYRQEWVRKTGWIIILLLVAGNYIWVSQNKEQYTVQEVSKIWKIFAPDTIQEHVADNKTVFIVFTAKWCVTCKFNEKFVLSNSEVENALSQPNVIAMKADWTHHDETIGKFLKSFNQYAIPCYIVFSPKYPNGHVLNTLITKDEVLAELPKTK